MRELSPFSQNLSMTRILCGSFEKLKKLPQPEKQRSNHFVGKDTPLSERARRNCPNSELPSFNLDQFFVSPLGGAKKRLGASDLTRGLHGHSRLRVRVGTLELPKRDKSIAKPQFTKASGLVRCDFTGRRKIQMPFARSADREPGG